MLIIAARPSLVVGTNTHRLEDTKLAGSLYRSSISCFNAHGCKTLQSRINDGKHNFLGFPFLPGRH